MSNFLKPRSDRSAAPAFLALAASCAIAFLAAAPAQAANDARVRIDDLDLSRPSDQLLLRQRAETAADRYCDARDVRGPLNARVRCRRAVVEEVAQAAAVAKSGRVAAVGYYRPVAQCEHR